MSNKLKPCPWCGNHSTIQLLTFNYYKIGCTNLLCSIQPSINFKWEELEIVEQKWNNRTDPTSHSNYIRIKIQNCKKELNDLKAKRLLTIQGIKKAKLTYKNLMRTPLEDIEIDSIKIFLEALREKLLDLDILYQKQKKYYTQLHSKMDKLNEKVWI